MNKIINYISYILCYTIFFYFISNYHFLTLLLATDNLLLSYNTICQIYKLPYIIEFYKNTFYFDRYIYYFFLYILNYILQILFFQHHIIIIYCIYITIIPPILSYFLLLKYKYIFDKIKLKLLHIKNYILYHFIKKLTTFICVNILDINPNFTLEEIEDICHQNYKEHLYTFIKNFIILIFVQSLSDGNTYLFKTIKILYNQNAIYKYKDPYPKINEINKIKKIIMKRHWKIFFNPYIINILTNLYQNKQNNNITLIMDKLYRKFEFIIIKILTIYYLNQIIILFIEDIHNYIYTIIFLLSLIINKFKINIKIILFKLIIVFLSYLYNNYILCIILCESIKFNYIFLDWYLKQCYQWCNKNYYILYHNNNYNKYILLNFIILCYLNFTKNITFNLIFIIVNSQYPLISLFLIGFGYFSNYNIIHCIILTLILYLFINIYYSSTAPKPKLNIDMISNYNNHTSIKIEKKYCHVLNLIHNPDYNTIPY